MTNDLRPSSCPAPSRYVLLSSSGRSGSNNLLDILDCHPRTFCRSEPASIPGMVMARLPESGFRPGDEPEPFPQDFPALWRMTLAAASRRNGRRDHFIGHHKDYFRHPWLAQLFQPLFGSGKARRWMARFAPAYGNVEWQVPSVYVSQRRLAQAIPVFKLNCAAGWIARVIDTEPGMKIVHNIREPRGFLQSWYNRYLVGRRTGNKEQVYRDNLRTLAPILDYYGAEWHHGQNFSEIALVESQLWRWRYFNEALMEFSDRPDRYIRVLYSEVTDDRVAVAERIFAFCGLDVDTATQGRIVKQQRRLFTEPHTTAADPAILDAALSRVLQNSEIAKIFKSI